MNDAQRITRWELLLLTGIVVLGVALRLYQIDAIPPGLHNDEAAYALDAQAVLHGQHALFFERNSGREPFFIYLLALGFQIFGATPVTIRGTAALIGGATILTTWWMVREIFCFAPEQQRMPPRWFALWAAAFLAISYWHLSFSRLGFRAITLPLLTTITFALLWRAWRQLRQLPTAPPLFSAFLGGAALGLTLYTYTAGRIAFVLFLATAGVTFWLAPRFTIARRRLLIATSLFLGAALLVAAPLLLYFATHPDYFAVHAAELSIFSPTYAQDGPIDAFVRSLFATLLMFVSSPDLNLRHNPAQIPVFDPLLVVWLGLGVVIAIATWRKLTPAFALLWFALFLTPAIFSAERPPHSLRALGVLPIVYVLPLLAMAWVASRAPIRTRPIMRLLPAPFWVFAAVVAAASYFGAWTPIDRFRPFFFVDFANLARDLAAPQLEGTRWLLPLGAPYGFNTVDFLLTHPDRFATVVTSDEEQASNSLAALTAAASPPDVYVLRWPFDPELPEFAWQFADPRGLVDFLLRRNSVGAATVGETPSGISYAAYTLVDTPLFSLPDTERETITQFGDAMQLTAFNVGAGADAALDMTGVLTFAADSPLWVVLRWQAQAPITSTVKTSLVVQDADGNWLTQVDDILAGARYPTATDWATAERANTYHVIDLPAGLAQGRYTLALRVYAEATGHTLPVVSETGAAASLTLATLDILPPLQPGGDVTPQFSPATPIQTDDLDLLGYDLPTQTVAPGDRVPLTLYLRAPTTPTTDYVLDVTLRAADGAIVAQHRATPGGDQFPTHAWRAGEIVRIPVALWIDPTLTNGRYLLHLAFDAGGEHQTSGDLAAVEIHGRPHVLAPPPIVLPMSATFGDAVRLLGVDAPDDIAVTPGAMVTVTLIWQPLRTETRPLVRFAQLLNDAGQLVAQQDTVPCDGACPATGWLAGEYLLDTATLSLPPDLPAGAYTLITGWYDPLSQQRLPAFDAAGYSLPDDAVIAPVAIQIE